MLPETSKCIGCGACINICPCQCIEMKYDREGFQQPHINSGECTSCHLCEKVCPVLGNTVESMRNKEEPFVYAVKDKNSANLQISSSGGFFGVVAEYVLRLGGCVFGVSYGENDAEVSYLMVEDINELNRVRGTKYVQAKSNYCFQLVAEQLKRERLVLFSGTPCSIAGVKKFLEVKKVPSSKLITIDIICHGVPAPFIYEQMISKLEEKHLKKVSKYIFRPKDLEWGASTGVASPKIIFSDGSSVRQSRFDKEYFYYYAFLSNMVLRESCYECQFAKLPRESDFTVGDFWGIEEDKEFPYECSDGVSCVLLNNDKASEIFECLKEYLDYKEEPLSLVINRNRSLVQKEKSKKARSKFYKRYLKNSLNSTARYVQRVQVKEYLITKMIGFVYKIIGQKGRNLIKRVVKRI